MARAGWLLLCFLSGCSASLRTSGPKACDIQKTAEIPIVVDRGFIAVPAVIGQQSVTMLLDTGAERTMLTPGTVSSLNLPRDPHARTTIRGTGGTITTQNVRLPSFEIGGVGSMDPSYAVGDLPVVQGSGTQASGLIGEDWLSDFDVDLDIPNHRVTLYTVQGCEGDYLPWQGARTSVTTFISGRGIMLLKVKLDDAMVTAVLDSGANRSIVSEQAAERAGVSASELSHDPTGRAKGVDGMLRVTHDHNFENVQIGNSRFSNVRLTVGPLSAASGADMLLGLDWLRSHRVWIAYRDRKVFIREGT